jgi:integrase
MRTTTHNKLTNVDIKHAGPKAILSDGGGLYLRYRSWVFRYTSPITGKERDLSLGSITSVTLKAARERAAEFRALIAKKVDPHHFVAEELEAKKAEAAKNVTFGDVTQKWMEEKLPDRKSPKNQRAVRNSLLTHTKPLANIPIASINSAMIADAMKPLKDRPAQRTNVVSLIHSIFDWAYAADILPEGLNPARAKKLSTLLPKRKTEVRHNRFGEVKDLPAFMARLQQAQGNLARVMELIVHTGLRQHEAVSLKWDWVNLADRSITIPATAMKAGKPHSVYLSNRAFEIVMGMLPQRREGGLVFPGGSETGGIGLRSLGTFLRDRFPDLGRVQVHGVRASFKSWATKTNQNRAAVEVSLAHAFGGAVESSYLDTDELRPVREQLMADWSAFLTSASPAPDATNLIQLHAQQN